MNMIHLVLSLIFSLSFIVCTVLAALAAFRDIRPPESCLLWYAVGATFYLMSVRQMELIK